MNRHTDDASVTVEKDWENTYGCVERRASNKAQRDMNVSVCGS